MFKNADSTPTYSPGQRVKVGSRFGRVNNTMEDGRVVIQFDPDPPSTEIHAIRRGLEKQASSAVEPIEPDQIEAV